MAPSRVSAGSRPIPGRLELQRAGVDAVTQPGRIRPVLEDMPEVPAGGRAHDLLTHHAVARVAPRFDRVQRRGLDEVGQPEPEWNFASDRKSSAPHPAHR